MPPVAEFVPEPLHDDPAVGRHEARHIAFLGEIVEEVGCRQIVEVVVLEEPARGLLTSALAVIEIGVELADERPKRPPQLDRPAQAGRRARTGSCRERRAPVRRLRGRV